MIKSVEITFDFGKLAGKMKSIISEFQEETILSESKEMTNRLKTGQTVKGAMDGLSDAAKITRILRGHSPSSPPLNASGKLLNSIKVRKSGISAKKYGLYQSRGFETKNNPVIPEGNKKPKGGLKKRQFKFSGKKIPERQWVHTDETFKYDKKVVRTLMNKIAKALKK
tara:strand:- start:1247 stop:1750 length:504 start_codon:yes stop_codon:yes gene_type:complete